MRRLIVQPGTVSGDRIHITDKDDITYLSIVLRMKEGDMLLVTDGAGRAWETSISTITREDIELSVLAENPAPEDCMTRVTLYQGLPKGAKMDEIIRKATELGVYKIVPVATARSIPGSVNMVAMKLERWRRIAKEASKQSMRVNVPEVTGLLRFEEAAAGLADATNGLNEDAPGIADATKGFEESAPGLAGERFDLILVPYELEEEMTLKQALREPGAPARGSGGNPLNIAVFIGPEGGFESSEVGRLVGLGAVSVTMGSTILRTETAGPAAVAMILYELS